MAPLERTRITSNDEPPGEVAAVLALPEIEGYDIIDVLGRGGMGVVYEAYQRSTGRRVAVKLLQLEWEASHTARQRFEREVELAARLQHPFIVGIVDASIHRGRYYYVMEFVDGRPLDAFVRAGAWEIPAALGLLANICDAVDYAHQRGVLHRDLKPSNILVDDKGRPHILDFGLAKAIDPESLGPREHTLSEPGQLLGTLGYMSPEQSRGSTHDLSVRSDVYSIGGIAYYLLTGRLPCDIDGALGDVLLRISEVDPPRPSALRADLAGDLDAILLKALEKAPERRYATVGELAADLRRSLARQPILARRASLGYRFTRWVQRNRTLTAVIALAVIALSIVGVTAFVRVASERDRARHEAQIATAFNRVMQQMFDSVDPNVAQSANFTVRAMLDHMAAEMRGTALANEEVRAALHEMLGRNYRMLDKGSEAVTHLTSALELRRRLLSAPHEDLARTQLELAAALMLQGRIDKAEELYRESLTIRRQLYPRSHPALAESLQGLGFLLKQRRRYDEADQCFRDALGMLSALQINDRLAAMTHNNYARSLIDQGCFEEAATHLRAALAIQRRDYPAGSWEEARSLKNLSRCMLGARGGAAQLTSDEFADIHSHLCRALDIERRLWGDDYPRLQQTLDLLGQLHSLENVDLRAVGMLCPTTAPSSRPQ